MVENGIDPHLLRKETFKSSPPLGLLIDIETRNLQDMVDRSLYSGEATLISGSLTGRETGYTCQDIASTVEMMGENGTGSFFPPWAALVLSGGTVEDLRKDYQSACLKGAKVFCVRFDRFLPSSTPESKARMGVLIVQAASFLKGRSVASLVPERYGGAVSERDLPEPVRLELLRTIAAQGFQWVELEDDLPTEVLKDLVQTARRSGSKVVLTTKVEGRGPLRLSHQDVLDTTDRVKVYLDTRSPGSVRNIPQILGPFRDSLNGNTLIVSPFGRFASLAGLLLKGPGSENVTIDLALKRPNAGVLPIQEDIPRFWSMTGFAGNEEFGDRLPLRRGLNASTGLFVQLGGLGTSNYRFDMFNVAFTHLGEDKIMVPWESRPEEVGPALNFLRDVGALGAVVEAPLRTVAMSGMDWVDPRSKLAGSIDLVVGKANRLYGYNTEVYAIYDVVKKGLEGKGHKCLILGTGTTGRAAAVGCSMLGLETVLVGSNLERTRALAGTLGGQVKGATLKVLRRPALTFDVIVSTVPFQQINEMMGGQEGMDLIGTVSSLRPVLGFDTTVVKGFSPFLAAVETSGGTPHKGSELTVSAAKRKLSIWLGREIETPDLTKVLEGSLD